MPMMANVSRSSSSLVYVDAAAVASAGIAADDGGGGIDGVPDFVDMIVAVRRRCRTTWTIVR